MKEGKEGEGKFSFLIRQNKKVSKDKNFGENFYETNFQGKPLG